jgi:hypothetical protein
VKSLEPDVNTVHDQEDAMGFVRRRARRRTALLVGGAAYAYGRNRGRDQGRDEGYQDAAYDEPPPAAAPAPAETIDYDELGKLGKLHADGTLTDEEFAAAKAKILGG